MILVVDDDEDVRDMLAVTLEATGCPIELAHDGPSALAAMTRQRPCLVVLDVVMPGMTGLQVLDEMVARGLDVPVCMISAAPDGPLPRGAVAMLCKPFDGRELLALATRYCSG